MSAIKYEKLEWDDIGRFIELRKMQLLEEGAAAVVDITDSLLDFYRRHLSDHTFVAWVAKVDGEIIATSGISFVEKPPYYSNPTGRIGIVSSMYTLPDFRRRGLATKLLGRIVEEAKNNGCGAIHITASKMGAHLYQAFGFERKHDFFQYKLD